MFHRLVLGGICFLAFPATLLADEAHPETHLPVWSVVPFVLLLLSIAVLPLIAPHFWHSNRNRVLVAAGIALPTVAFLYIHQSATQEPTMATLGHVMMEYVSFILLLGSLYTISGGIVFRGDRLPRPRTNTAILLFGCVLANFVGTTGASMLLIRPLLRINRHRRHTSHLPIFFIFTVSNLGGLLTPLGDPPLFLGYLRGVPFFWTLTLWPQWLAANGMVLLLFYVADSRAFAREGPEGRSAELLGQDTLHVEGKLNFLLLGGVIAAVLMQKELEEPVGQLVGGGVMFLMAAASWLLTSRSLRLANGFTWAPILEVAILFAGIFVTMVPALEIVREHSSAFGFRDPWQFFWGTGALSAFLDNAPTYVTFASLALGDRPGGLSTLVAEEPLILAAISCGAVFMGAMTYIGNGPNFMVKAIADEAGYRTPSFFGYLAYSVMVLVPVFLVVTVFFFLGR